jgi:hypothetical protein
VTPPPEIPEQPAAQFTMPGGEEDDSATRLQPSIEANSLAWLADIAAQSDNVFNLDLGAFEEEPAPADPEAWLQNIAMSQGENVSTVASAEATNLDNGLNWLESIALQRGAEPEELVTEANLDISVPEEEAELPAYTPFSFEMPASPRANIVETPSLENPADWLNAIAAGEGYSEGGVLATQFPTEEADFSDESIKEAISEGTVTPEQMEHFLQRQMEYAQTLPEDEEVVEVLDDQGEEPLVEAEIPGWLLEIQAEGAQDSSTEDVERIPLDQLFPGEEPAPIDFEQIISPPAMEPMNIDVDISDPWVEALDTEYAQGGVGDIGNPPEWYLENIQDPERIAEVELMSAQAEDGLDDEALPPEYDLPFGEPQPMPAWLKVGTIDVTPISTASVFEEIEEPEPAATTDSDLPDWMTQSLEEPELIPDWNQLVDAEQVPVFAVEAVTPSATAPTVEVHHSPPPAAAPRPVYQGSASLESARERQRSGDIAGSLQEYEALVAHSIDLEAVVEDLSGFVRIHRENPTAFRLLGDGYMRQGNLQQALDTYREALNYL